MEERKKEKLRGELKSFVRQYARKTPKNSKEPNDRCYDRKLAERIKKMKPEDVMNG